MKTIRENFSLIIAIPTLLGGLWQVSQLVFISPIFLRFFSLSQLISDGIFIGLIILLSIVIPYLMALGITKCFAKYSERVKLIISTIFAVLYGVALLLNFDRENYRVFYVMLFAYGFFQNYLFAFSRSYRLIKFEKFDKTIMIVLISVGVICSSIDIISLMSEFSKSSKTIENLKYVEFEIRKQNPCAKIEYFNDKYIFIEKDSVSLSKTYIIKKFEVLTEIQFPK